MRASLYSGERLMTTRLKLIATCLMALGLLACKPLPTSQDVGLAALASVFPVLIAAYVMHMFVSLIRYETLKLSIPKRMFHGAILIAALCVSMAHMFSLQLDFELFKMLCVFTSLSMGIWMCVVWLCLFFVKGLRKDMDVMVPLSVVVVFLLPAIALEQQWLNALTVEMKEQAHHLIFAIWVVPGLIWVVPVIPLIVLVVRERRAAKREDDLMQQAHATSEIFS
jgi:hypothetical protein